MMDRRIHELPLTGKVVLANPVNEWSAQKVAASEDLPYFLHSSVLENRLHVFVMDVKTIRGIVPGVLA
jgi:hypothetical protein